jgi:hypothetical protein
MPEDAFNTLMNNHKFLSYLSNSTIQYIINNARILNLVHFIILCNTDSWKGEERNTETYIHQMMAEEAVRENLLHRDFFW